MPTFTPLSFRRGVLEGGMGVRFPAGLKTLGVVGLRKGACFGMPLRGAAQSEGGVSGPAAMAEEVASLLRLVCSMLFHQEQGPFCSVLQRKTLAAPRWPMTPREPEC